MSRTVSLEGRGVRIDTGDPVMTVLRGGVTLELRGSIVVDKHRTPSMDVSADVLETVMGADGTPERDSTGAPLTKALMLKASAWHDDGTAAAWLDVETGASLLVVG